MEGNGENEEEGWSPEGEGEGERGTRHLKDSGNRERGTRRLKARGNRERGTRRLKARGEEERHAPAKPRLVAVLRSKLRFTCFLQVPTGSHCLSSSPLAFRLLVFLLSLSLYFPQVRQVYIGFLPFPSFRLLASHSLFHFLSQYRLLVLNRKYIHLKLIITFLLHFIAF